jgi:two-component system nitrate/nitrite response regulator NarL
MRCHDVTYLAMPEELAGCGIATSPQTDGSHPSIKILLAGHHTILRTGLCRLLAQEPGFQVLDEAANGADAARLAEELKPDILLVEAGMPVPISKAMLAGLAGKGRNIRMLLLAVPEDEGRIREAFSRGFHGVLLKSSDSSLLIRAIRSVMEGNMWLANKAISSPGDKLAGLASMISNLKRSQPFGLTRRESEVVAKVVGGYSNKEIAGRLSITEDTVKHHLTSIFDKTGAGNRLELALFAIHHGLMGGKARAAAQDR